MSMCIQNECVINAINLQPLNVNQGQGVIRGDAMKCASSDGADEQRRILQERVGPAIRRQPKA